MFWRNRYRITFVLLALAMARICPAALKEGDTLPALDSFKLEGKIRFIHRGFIGDETVTQYQEQIQLLLKEPAH